MSWFDRVRSAVFGDSAISARPAYSYGQFCDDEEADRCRAEIDRLVDEFLARRQAVRRLGREDLTRSKPLHVGHTPVRERLGIVGQGMGWRHLRDGLFGLYVQNDGYWYFQGYHTWRHPPGARTV